MSSFFLMQCLFFSEFYNPYEKILKQGELKRIEEKQMEKKT
ncbi:hypothetical protein [Peptoniphilus sp. SGI.035]